MKKLLIGIIIALVICTALGVVAKVATPDTISGVFRTYSVEGDVTNGVLGDISKLKAGSSVTVELSAEEGYALPETVTVTGASYEYDQAAGTLTLSNPTDNVEIEVVCVPIIWDITSSITNGSASGDTTIATGGTASVTLAAAAGYYLNYEILVTGASYTYNSTTGVVSLSAPTGNVEIYSACLPSYHVVRVNISNGDADGATIVNYEPVDAPRLYTGGTLDVTLLPNYGYALPSSVEVTNATFSYNSTTGVVSLSEPVGTVYINCECRPVDWTITTNVSNCRVDGATGIATGDTASVTLTAASGYTLPSTVTVTNATLDSYAGGVVTISNPMGDVTISGACTANIYAITTSVMNATASGDTTIATGGTASVMLTSASGFILPSTVTVTNATLDSYMGGVVTISNAMGDVTISGACIATYPITTSVTNATASGATTISTGSTASVTLTAPWGYTLPSTVTVTNATVDSYLRDYSNTVGFLELSSPTGDVTISGACTANTYAITTSVTNATASGATTISTGSTASVTLTAASGYTLPSTVTVTNATLDSYTGGVVTISNPTGYVTISGACTANTYAITTSVTNATASGATTISTGSTASVTLTAASGFTLPSTVTVTNATLDSYTGGVVTISNPTGNVTISGACDQVQQQPAQTYSLTITGHFECQAGGFPPVLYVNSIAPENRYLFDGTAYANVVEGNSLPFTINDVSQIIFWLDYGYGYGTFALNGVEYSSQMLEGGYDENNPITVVLSQNSTLNVVWGED